MASLGVSPPSTPEFKNKNNSNSIKKRKYVLRDLPAWVVEPVADFVARGPRVMYVKKKKQANWDSFVAALLCEQFSRAWWRCLRRLSAGRNHGGDCGLVPDENLRRRRRKI